MKEIFHILPNYKRLEIHYSLPLSLRSMNCIIVTTDNKKSVHSMKVKKTIHWYYLFRTVFFARQFGLFAIESAQCWCWCFVRFLLFVRFHFIMNAMHIYVQRTIQVNKSKKEATTAVCAGWRNKWQNTKQSFQHRAVFRCMSMLAL